MAININRITQQYKNKQISIIQTAKSIGWLVNRTYVNVFNPITFEGYQRQIDEKHSDGIVSYLETNTLLPTSIICAIDNEYTDDSILRIVDGQHRVHAFKSLKEKNPDRYQEIKDVLIPVIILENVELSTEIDTFITINKTSKKVDTSLALVLKNKINIDISDISVPKKDYLSVELAIRLNSSTSKSIWSDKILFEGNVKNTPQTISLNAFVKANRILISALVKKHYIYLDWKCVEDIDEILNYLERIENLIWDAVEQKWPLLFIDESSKNDIIQGAIGYTSITRYIAFCINNVDSFNEGDIYQWIFSICVDTSEWLPGNRYSKYTSVSGYNYIANELYDSALSMSK